MHLHIHRNMTDLSAVCSAGLAQADRTNQNGAPTALQVGIPKYTTLKSWPVFNLLESTQDFMTISFNLGLSPCVFTEHSTQDILHKAKYEICYI